MISMTMITKTHIFGECDLDLTKSAKEVWNDLFDICEATGFFPTQEKYGFSVVGPFNVPDAYNYEAVFQVGHPTEESKEWIVTDVFGLLKNPDTNETIKKHILYRAGQNIEPEVLL